MFRFYKEKIQQKQPEGPYRVAGYSFGTLIAIEIVIQLQQEGKEVVFY